MVLSADAVDPPAAIIARSMMKPGMLGSQLAVLELPVDAIVVDVSRSLDEVCADVAERIRHHFPTGPR